LMPGRCLAGDQRLGEAPRFMPTPRCE
jgi:hypothetical protein